MLNLSKSNPFTSTPPPPSGPAVSPPVVHPDQFEDFPVFRETFLLFFTDPKANASTRNFGLLLHELVLEFWGQWPPHREGMFPSELRAVVADLRHLQGCLQEWTGPACPVDGQYERRLSEVGADVARGIAKLADRLEVELGSWLEGASS
ncbi:MAG: hypothetical protein QOF89_1095 [Acidobacteriota bacterium]|jgi:hypothetical protein|nr:hypothetical protein [Acidobacteriota bacterium]